MRSIRKHAAITLAATAALTLAACSSSGSSATPTSGGNKHVTLTWWTNATTGTLKTVWAQAAAAYHKAHPNVAFQIEPFQNEAFTTKVPAALAGNNPPDIYQQWGSGQEATQVPSGKLTDLTPLTSSWIGQLGNAANAWQVNGKQYGVPYDLHTVGFWYRKDLFTKAGITSPPTTMAELNADVAKLKAAHIAPIAVGSKDKWPDAFWWEYFAVRECATDTLKAAIKADNLSAPCFVKAGTDLKSFMSTNPFQTGFLGTAAQVGPGSSVGMVANGKAAMELQGDWDPGTMTPLTANKNLNSQLGWFPFPSVPVPDRQRRCARGHHRAGRGRRLLLHHRGGGAGLRRLPEVPGHPRGAGPGGRLQRRPAGQPRRGIGADPARNALGSAVQPGGALHPDLLRHRPADQRRPDA
jgi:raffinose/stachyose/melibiose transport system substrate-binding protein